MKNRGIAFKLIFFLTLFNTFIFLIVFGYNYFHSLKIIKKDMKQNIENLTNATVNKVNTVLSSIQMIPQNLKLIIETHKFNREELIAILRSIVKGNTDIYGAAIAFEPYAFDNKSLYFAPYFCKKDDILTFSYLGGDNYRYFYKDWYQIPKELNSPQWSEPYIDKEAGNILMTTYSVPFYRMKGGKKKFLGVITVDVSLEWLKKIISSIKILKTGYCMLISKNGTFITHPLKRLIMNDTIFTVADATGNKYLRKLGRKMIHGDTGIAKYTNIFGKPCYMYYTPIPSNGWVLAALFPIKEVTEDIVLLNRNILIAVITGILLLLLITIIISKSITEPLRKVTNAVSDIGEGNLDIELPPIKNNDEVGKLTLAFHNMIDSLKQYISDLKKTTAAKERIESELKIAHQIQMSILPKIFPPFEGKPNNIDLYAFIEPAKGVGGDFYDFFFIDDEHFCFIIGDVSGKGIPASLFMAVTITLLKTKASEIDPGKILTRANTDLCNGNDNFMFVTVFCGVINIKSGEVIYANAGHNSPLFVKKGKNAMYLETTKGIALGVMENIVFETKRIVMEPGDYIFTYTDGVTEAMNDNEELFSEEKLIDIINNLSNSDPKNIILKVKDEIQLFANGTPQSDDITMMIMKFKGAEAEIEK